jgi:esterase/lipase superfamily enzyme
VGITVNGVAAYGNSGPPARPVLAFPAERGDAGEFERRGMVAAVGDLLAAGRVKLYCVDSFDHASWLKRADVFPLAICLSGNYDPSAWDGWGERGDAAYFNNPMDYVSHLGGDHLDWLRAQLAHHLPRLR